jgi:hypothetical protein
VSDRNVTLLPTKKRGVIYTRGYQRIFIARYKYYEEESMKAKGGGEKYWQC